MRKDECLLLLRQFCKIIGDGQLHNPLSNDAYVSKLCRHRFSYGNLDRRQPIEAIRPLA
jgi:hypothetical protein